MADLDSMSEAERAKLLKHRAYQRAYMKAWRRKDPRNGQKQSESARAWQKKNPIRNARNQYKQVAAKRGLAYELSDDLFEALVKGACHYCGSPADPINGIDRVDNAAGYVPGNVVTACRQCNVAKSFYCLARFREWVLRVARRFEESSNGSVPEN